MDQSNRTVHTIFHEDALLCMCNTALKLSSIKSHMSYCRHWKDKNDIRNVVVSPVVARAVYRRGGEEILAAKKVADRLQKMAEDATEEAYSLLHEDAEKAKEDARLFQKQAQTAQEEASTLRKEIQAAREELRMQAQEDAVMHQEDQKQAKAAKEEAIRLQKLSQDMVDNMKKKEVIFAKREALLAEKEALVAEKEALVAEKEATTKSQLEVPRLQEEIVRAQQEVLEVKAIMRKMRQPWMRAESELRDAVKSKKVCLLSPKQIQLSCWPVSYVVGRTIMPVFHSVCITIPLCLFEIQRSGRCVV